MVVKPHIEPKIRHKRRSRPHPKDYNEFKDMWHFERHSPIPMGNPYSKQPWDYHAKSQFYKTRSTRKERLVGAMTPDITASGDIIPHISRRQAMRVAGKLGARLHPVTLAISLAGDAKMLYDIFKS